MITDSKLTNLDFADILLLPQKTDIESRDEVILFNDGDLSAMPIFSSPMKGISEPNMVVEIAHQGGIGMLHRFFSDENERYLALNTISSQLEQFETWGVAIGVNNFHQELDFADSAISRGAKFICIDTANGYMEKTIRAVEALNGLKKLYKENTFYIISGNVIDDLGVIELAKAGSDYVRVGIGSGGLCSTSNFTAIGCPALTAIQESAKAKKKYSVKIIADGGIKSSGEAVKAFAFGADAVMIGGLFGKALEADNGGVIYGMSSYKLQQAMGKDLKSNEGLVKEIPVSERLPIANIFKELTYGIKSGLSYLNCRSIKELHKAQIEYVRVGNGTIKQI